MAQGLRKECQWKITGVVYGLLLPTGLRKKLAKKASQRFTLPTSTPRPKLNTEYYSFQVEEMSTCSKL